MSSPKAPPAPDYSGVAAASAEAAKYQYALGKEQLQWAKEQYTSDKEITTRVVDAALRQQADNDATARKDRERYETVYQPLEDKYVQEAQDYNSDAARDKIRADGVRNAGGAAAAVSQQFAQARTAAQAQLEAYGVDPSQTRASALDLGTRTAEAAARAGAVNTVGAQTTGRLDQREADGLRLQSSAIDIGKGYPGSIAGQYGSATAGGAQAASTALAQTQQGGQLMGTSTQYNQLGNTALTGWTGALNGQANANNERFKANQSASSGIGGILGLGLGIGKSLLTGGMFEEGGAVPEPVNDDAYDHSGIPIRREMSPSGGQATDDIPARLNAGEFIVPEDTVRWFGEKHLQTLIEKGRKEQAEAPAKPRMGAIPVERPEVNSSAIAVGR